MTKNRYEEEEFCVQCGCDPCDCRPCAYCDCIPCECTDLEEEPDRLPYNYDEGEPQKE